MYNVDALIGSSPRIMRIESDLHGECVVEVEYDLPRENEGDVSCTVELMLSMPEVHEWCKRLDVYETDKFRNVNYVNL